MAPKDHGLGICWMSLSVFPSKQGSIDASRSNDPHSKEATERSEKISFEGENSADLNFFSG